MSSKRQPVPPAPLVRGADLIGMGYETGADIRANTPRRGGSPARGIAPGTGDEAAEYIRKNVPFAAGGRRQGG